MATYSSQSTGSMAGMNHHPPHPPNFQFPTNRAPPPPPLFAPAQMVSQPNNIMFHPPPPPFPPPPHNQPSVQPHPPQHQLEIAPSLFPSPTPNSVDLDTISVGALANIAKTAKRLGHPPYAPIDMNIIAQTGTPYVEPGRVEARLNDFYKKLNALIDPTGEAAQEVSGVSNKRDHNAIMSAIEKYGSGVIEEDTTTTVTTSHYATSNKQARYQQLLMEHQQQHAQPEIDSSNIGHAMLSSMGWESGQGLGNSGVGMQVPITSTMKSDKSGLGASSGSGMGVAAGFHDYRSLMSGEYKMKMQDRDASKK